MHCKNTAPSKLKLSIKILNWIPEDVFIYHQLWLCPCVSINPWGGEMLK